MRLRKLALMVEVVCTLTSTALTANCHARVSAINVTPGVVFALQSGMMLAWP
jgi:hypothetical protein